VKEPCQRRTPPPPPFYKYLPPKNERCGQHIGIHLLKSIRDLTGNYKDTLVKVPLCTFCTSTSLLRSPVLLDIPWSPCDMDQQDALFSIN